MEREDFSIIKMDFEHFKFILTEHFQKIGIIKNYEYVKDFSFSFKSGFRLTIEKEDF